MSSTTLELLSIPWENAACSLIANLTQQVNISEELNILFWNNKKSGKPFKQPGSAPQQRTNLQFKLCEAPCASVAKMMTDNIQCVLQRFVLFSPQIVTNQATHR